MIRLVIVLLLLASCTPVPMTPERAADLCEERARAAQGPTGTVTMGVNSRSGPDLEGSIGITSDYLNRRDPMEVYVQCVYQRTGQGPIRPPALR